MIQLIEELKDEDYNTRMLEEKIQSLQIEKAKKCEEVKKYQDLLATRKTNPLNEMMNKRKREEYLKHDGQALKEELKDELLEAQKRKIHIMLTEDQKKRVVEISEAFGPVAAEELTGICDKSIMRWAAKGKENLKRKTGSGRKVKYPNFEKKLLDYYKDLRKNGIGLSTRKLILHARSEAKKDKNIQIKFSRGWLQKFMRRNKISMRKKSTTVQKPIDQIAEISKKFLEKVHKLIYDTESKYDQDHIINVDETSIQRDAPPERTMEDQGAKKVVISSGGKEKERITTVVTISLTGKRLGQMIILKGKGIKKVKCVVPNDVIISYNEKSSWMTSSIMLEWANFILAPHAKKLPPGKFGLLIMDNHKTHLDEKVVKKIESFKYHIQYLPPNTTGCTQPVDIGMNKPIKSHYQIMWENWFEEMNQKYPKTSHYKSPSKELMISWIWKSLRKIPQEEIMNSWKVYKNLDLPLQDDGN